MAAVRSAALAILYVLAWLIGLLAIGGLELLVNPEGDYNTAGRLLNELSVVVAGAGLLLVPIGAVAIHRVRGHDWPLAVGVGVAALAVYLLGVLLCIVVFLAIGGTAP
jgi:hypothetical protein